jgi:hypothetical protein
MWGPFFGTQYVASIVDASTGSYTLYEEDPANAGQTIAMQSPATIAPWEEQMAPYGLYACYKMTLEDGQSTNYGDNHMIAAMALADRCCATARCGRPRPIRCRAMHTLARP